MVLRSSCHTLRKGLGRRRRRGDWKPRVGSPLPDEFVEEIGIEDYDAERFDLRGEVIRVLEMGLVACGAAWFEIAGDLETLRVDLSDREATLEKQQLLTASLASDERFHSVFVAFVETAVLPLLPGTEFWLQTPPTLRIQPGPSDVFVKEHRDEDYGHQPGEINFWLPLTDPRLTRTTLWVEDSPVAVGLNQVAWFHGSSRRHSVPANASTFTRVSMDFRVGLGGSFDPQWSLRGTVADHSRIHIIRGS